MTTTRAFLSRAEAAEYVQSHGLPLARGTLHAARCTLHAARCTLHAARCTLQKYATTGEGPRYHKFGQRCVYRREDLDAWMATKLGRPVTFSSNADASDERAPIRAGRSGTRVPYPRPRRSDRLGQMTSRQVESMRTAGGSVTLADLTAQALVALQAAGPDFGSLELDAGFRRKPGHDHLWYVADTGVDRSGKPWLMVTAGDAKVTGDVSTPLVVYKSWETERATIDPAESADIQCRIEAASAPSSGQRQPWESEHARPA